MQPTRISRLTHLASTQPNGLDVLGAKHRAATTASRAMASVGNMRERYRAFTGRTNHGKLKLLAKTLLEKPLYFTTGPSPKISGRGNYDLVRAGLKLGEGLNKASKEFGGEGGGHDVAAGAKIPPEKKEDFLNLIDKIVAEQLKKN